MTEETKMQETADEMASEVATHRAYVDYMREKLGLVEDSMRIAARYPSDPSVCPDFFHGIALQIEAFRMLQKGCSLVSASPQGVRDKVLKDVALRFGEAAGGLFSPSAMAAMPVVDMLGKAGNVPQTDRDKIAVWVREGEIANNTCNLSAMPKAHAGEDVAEKLFDIPSMDGTETEETKEDIRRAHILTILEDASSVILGVRNAILADPGRAIHKAPRFVFNFAEQAEAYWALERGCALIRDAAEDAKKDVLNDVAFQFGYVAHGRFPRPLTVDLPVVQWFGEAMGLEGSDRDFIADLVREGEAEAEKDRAEYLSAKCPHYGTAACLQKNCTSCGVHAPDNGPSETAEA